MGKLVTIAELVDRIPGGTALGIGGVHFSRVPIALIEALLAAGKRDFTFISWGGGVPLEMFLEAGAVKKLASRSPAWTYSDWRRVFAKHSKKIASR